MTDTQTNRQTLKNHPKYTGVYKSQFDKFYQHHCQTPTKLYIAATKNIEIKGVYAWTNKKLTN